VEGRRKLSRGKRIREPIPRETPMVIVSQLPFVQVPPRAIPKEIITPPLQEMNEFKATLNGFKGAQCPEADHRIPASHPSHQPKGRSDV
jgi:hypothetical protein